MQPRRKKGPVTGLFATAWVATVATGGWLMLQHEFAAGDAMSAPAAMPAELSAMLGDAAAPFALVISIHPDCPCTAASVEQVDRLMARHPGALRPIALFWMPDAASVSSDLRGNAYWERLSALPGARLATDPGGALAAALGAPVSGAVALYDREGALRFQGGLTASRGHAGSSRGTEAIDTLIAGAPDERLLAAPAFGCAFAERTDR